MNNLKKSIWISVLLCISLLLSFCGGNSTDSGNGGNGGGNQVTLTATPSPADGGTISPSSGTFDPGTDVTVTATPTNSGWEFVEWTGDIQSTDNPLTFTIQSNTTLTGNFNAVSSVYQMNMTVSDSLFSQELVFGQNENSTSGTGDTQDRELPPPPPQGALYSYFKTGSVNLDRDFRSFTTDTLDWNLQYQVGSGDSLSLSWSLTQTRLEGTLTIASADSSILVDMLSQQSLSFPVSAADSLIIHYRFQDQ